MLSESARQHKVDGTDIQTKCDITSGRSSFLPHCGCTKPQADADWLHLKRLGGGRQINCLEQLTSAMATAPFSVKVLSFKFITFSNELIAKAWASAVMPGWLIPFCGIWTSSRVPMICKRMQIQKRLLEDTFQLKNIGLQSFFAQNLLAIKKSVSSSTQNYLPAIVSQI